MAASMRIKITDVRLDNDHLRDYVDPFWLLVSKEQHPFISDIGKRILLTCDATRKLSQNVKDSEGESDDNDGPSPSSPSSVSASPTSNASCQLWLDGCRLPDTERTEILRDNDSIVVKILTQNVSKDARALPRSLDVLEGDAGNDVSLERDSHKRKRSKSGLDSESLPLDDSIRERKKKKRKKDKEGVEEVKKKRKANVSCNDELTTQSFKNDSVHNVSKSADTSGMKEKSKSDHKSSLKNSFESEYNSKSVKKKKKKEKQYSGEKKSQHSMDTSCDSISKSLVNEMSVDHDQVDAIQNVSSSIASISEIEKQKKKLLGKLDNFVESGKIPCDKQISEVKPTSPQDEKDETIADISVEPRKRRRRKQKKKPRDKDGDKTVIRVEDKPKSSVLNLPQSMRPQNCKITFNSESDEPTEEMEVNNVDERPAEIDKTKAKVEVPEMKGKFSDGSEGVKKNEKDRLGSISMSKNYKELSPTCRKYLMRSTGSILDSLRSTNSNTSSYSVPCDLSVTTKSARKSSPHEPVAIKSSLPTPTHTKSDGASKFHTPVIKSSCELFGKVGSAETSKVNGDVSIGENSQRNTSSSPLDNEQLNAQSTSVDCEAKFIELLQRRRLSNTSCNVVTSQNGITICSRNKSPRWNPHAQSNGFADPARDVLTNVSSITQFNGNGQLPSMSTPSSRPSGKSTVGNDAELKKVEVFPVDIEKCPVLSGNPNTGDILAYKVLEMNEDYNPVVSDFKTGKVMSCENGFVALKLFGNTAPKKLNGKFELVYDDEEQMPEPSKIHDEQVNVEIASMMDTRLIERHTDTSDG